MKTTKIKLSVIAIVTLGSVLVFIGVQPNLSSDKFAVYDFLKGMLAGIGSVAAALWLYFLILMIKRSDRSKGIISAIINNKQIKSSLIISLLLMAATITVYFSHNIILLAAGTIITGVSMVLNILYHKKILRRELVNN